MSVSISQSPIPATPFAVPANRWNDAVAATLSLSPAEPATIPLYGDETRGQRSSGNWSTAPGMGIRNVTYPTLTPVWPNQEKLPGLSAHYAERGDCMIEFD